LRKYTGGESLLFYPLAVPQFPLPFLTTTTFPFWRHEVDPVKPAVGQWSAVSYSAGSGAEFTQTEFGASEAYSELFLKDNKLNISKLE